jgi:hypothetical protein
MGSEAREGEFGNAREASPEEREFHAQQGNGSREDEQQPRPPAEAARDSSPPAERSEPPREQRHESTQAPLDLPPPPQSKPFVVWSSSPPGDSPTHSRDE